MKELSIKILSTNDDWEALYIEGELSAESKDFKNSGVPVLRSMAMKYDFDFREVKRYIVSVANKELVSKINGFPQDLKDLKGGWHGEK